MKIKLLIFLTLLMFTSSWISTNAQVDVTLTIENQNTVGTDFFFDIFLTAPNDPLYLGNADFVLTFNDGNFTSPVISKEGVSYCTFVPTDASGNNPLFTQDAYYNNTSPDISGNVIIINLNGPAPSDQNNFDTRVAKIDNQASTHRLGRFKISGITNTSGSMGLQWKTSGTGVITQVFTLAPTTPWTSNSVNSINAVNPSDAPLPVELTTFKVNSIEGTKAKLEWETATEVNNYGFEIERAVVTENAAASTNSAENADEDASAPLSKNWEKVAFVEGHGNSNSPKLYSFVDDKLIGGSKFVYRLKQIDIDGTFEYSDEIEVEVLPVKYELFQNYPNPFNPSTLIKFSLPEDAKLAINIYNLLGEKVTTLLNSEFKAGFHEINFNSASAGYSLASGVYIYTIESKNFTKVKKMILMK